VVVTRAVAERGTSGQLTGRTVAVRIVYLDYATQRRIPKASALWYRDWIAVHSEVGDAERPHRAG
jgi:hypothetical protein